MRKSLFDIAYEQLHRYITENNLRHSAKRTQILQEICLLPQPFTEEQLEQACEPLHVARASIFNALNMFVLAQILHADSRHRGQTHTQYELITGRGIRMEVICKQCGRVTELRDKAIVKMIKEKHYSNFELQHFTLFVYGECKVCRQQNAKKA